jgi:hypothetical protein
VRARLPDVLALLGAVLLALGLLAGAVNREILDGARFAAVDQLNGVS